MSTGWIVLGVIVVLAFLAFGAYNRLVALSQRVGQAFADIDVQLKQRHDLIPNLVEVTKGYAGHEREIYEKIADARARLIAGGSRGEQINAATELGGALSRLLAIAERYPNLKADKQFAKLSDELAGTENRIAVERGRYNEAVQAYNTRIRTFPDAIGAKIFYGAKPRVPFEAVTPNADRAPQVNFNLQ